MTGLTLLVVLAAAATGAVFYFDKTDDVSRWIAEAKTWIEKEIERQSFSPGTNSKTISDSISESELTSFFNWTPPDGWQSSPPQNGADGENVLTFVATKAELPTVEAKFAFKRDRMTDAMFRYQLKQSANADAEMPTWLEERRIGQRTLYTSESSGKLTRITRNYYWLVAERSVQCSINVSGDPEELEQAIAALEPSFKDAIAMQRQQETKPGLKSKHVDSKKSGASSDSDVGSPENKIVPDQLPPDSSLGTTPPDSKTDQQQ
jgi:hypothetical protein